MKNAISNYKKTPIGSLGTVSRVFDVECAAPSYISIENEAQLDAAVLGIKKGDYATEVQFVHLPIAPTIKKLADALKSSDIITKVGLQFHNLGDAEAITIAEILDCNQSINSLNLSYNKIGLSGIQAIAAALGKRSEFNELNLASNNIDDEGLRSLASALKPDSSFDVINLCFNDKITKEGASAFIEEIRKKNVHVNKCEMLGYTGPVNDPIARQKTSIRSLGVVSRIYDVECVSPSYISIESEEQLDAVALSIKKGDYATEVQFIHLPAARTIQKLADALKSSTTITKVGFLYHDLGDAEAIIIAGMLDYNKSITSLDLSKNSIGLPGIQAIATALGKKSTFNELNLAENNIDDEGLLSLAKALKPDSSFDLIDLFFNNKITPECVDVFIQELCEKNIHVNKCRVLGVEFDINIEMSAKAAKQPDSWVERVSATSSNLAPSL